MIVALVLPWAAFAHGGLRFASLTHRHFAVNESQSPDIAANESKSSDIGMNDTAADELVDQANPNFEKISNGDGCIDEQELLAVSMSRVPPGPERDELAPQIEEMTSTFFKAMDAIDQENGCISEDEFRKGNSGASPPPDAPSEEVKQFRKVQFDAMDQNEDHRVSRSEAYDFVAHLEHASVHQEKVDAIFKAADANYDKFLSEDEYMNAGAAYKGDGPGVFLVSPSVSTLERMLAFVATTHKHPAGALAHRG